MSVIHKVFADNNKESIWRAAGTACVSTITSASVSWLTTGDIGGNATGRYNANAGSVGIVKATGYSSNIRRR